MTSHTLYEERLSSGRFEWTTPLRNIQAGSPDTPTLWSIGGTGIHFTPTVRRYRTMFDFLEDPRLAVALKVKKGPVRDVVSSTQRPDELEGLLQSEAAGGAPPPPRPIQPGARPRVSC